MRSGGTSENQLTTFSAI